MTIPQENDLQSVHRFLDRGFGHVHLVGICGIGMAGLAFLLKTRGFRVTGCDRAPGSIADWLRARGIEVFPEHDPAHVGPGVTWVIRSAAVSPACAEIVHARERGVDVFLRGAVLPGLLRNRMSVAVAGTHGKTTTTAFIVQLLKSAGRDPSWCIGGETDVLGGVSAEGHEKTMIVEADESDGTIALYKPDIAVVTNIEFDHMEHFKSRESFEECFRGFIRNARRKVVFCADDPRAALLAGNSDKSLSYGFSDKADVRGRHVRETGVSLSFTVERGRKEFGRVRIPVIGRHNALNALAAIAVTLELGQSFEEIVAGLKLISLPRRRFERIVEKNNILVISDYAHHPSEISALVQTAEKLTRSRRRHAYRKRLLAAFQPHRYSRTLALGRDFPPAFKGVDDLILIPVYAASEEPLKGGTVWDLYARFRERQLDERPPTRRSGRSRSGPRAVAAASSCEQAWAYIRRELGVGDTLLIVGAGDVERIGQWAGDHFRHAHRDQTLTSAPARTANLNADALTRCPGPDDRLESTILRYNVPLADKTTLKVGGRADIWAEIGSVEDLRKILAWAHDHEMPFNVIGKGSNVLISDLGVRGVTARLGGSVFSRIRSDDDMITVGAGVPVAKLMNWLQEHNLEGLEFLEGIPGTIGGGLRMNAGAWGHELAERLSWIRCLSADGSERIVEKSVLAPSYRRCEYLENRVAMEAGLSVEKGDPAEIRKRRAAISKRREWMSGLRSAGSVFKNPEGNSAARLIEQAGLKGCAIGGASFSAAHANFIVTEAGACASDVRALIERARSEVTSRFGVRLDTEIVFLE